MNARDDSKSEISLMKAFESKGIDFHTMCSVVESLDVRELLKMVGWLQMLVERKLGF